MIMAYGKETIEKIKQLNAEGKTNKEIATELKMSPTTVRKHLNSLGADFNSKRIIRDATKEFSKDQLEVLYGSLLGDMCIMKETTNARASINQGGNQELYFDHKCEIFKDFLGSISKTPRYDKRTNKYYNKFTVRLCCHPQLTEIYNMIVINGVKTITRKYLELLTPKSLAYWWMDDGNVRGIFATMCFSKEENELIKTFLFEKFGIESSVHKFKGGTGWTLYITKAGRSRLFELIEPYVIDSMKYKIGS
jgi:hypothetical protein